MSEVSDLLALAGFLAANPGIKLGDAARATHRTPAQLIKDLDKLLMCGVPPYSPSDYISYGPLTSKEESRIKLFYAAHFRKPLSFTPKEALALRYALEHYRRVAPDETSARIDELAETLSEAMSGRARESFSESGAGFVVPRRTQRLRDLVAELERAAESKLLAEIDYYSAHRGRRTSRVVHPYSVIEAGPNLYLYAFCELAEATRHFRLDRIATLKVTGGGFTSKPPRERKAGRMTGIVHARAKERMRVRIAPERARDVLRDFKESPDSTLKLEADGSAVLELPLFNQFWATGFVTSFGGDATLLSPDWLRNELAMSIRSALQAHN